MSFDLPTGYKFSCFALEGVPLDLPCQDPIDLGNGLWVVFEPPFDLTLDAYLDELRVQLAKGEKIRNANESETDPELVRPIPDFSKLAWERMKDQGRLPGFRTSIPYSGRKDGMNHDVPNVCLKIPTGGGKTLLAAYSISHVMSRYPVSI